MFRKFGCGFIFKLYILFDFFKLELVNVLLKLFEILEELMSDNVFIYLFNEIVVYIFVVIKVKEFEF